MQLDCTALKSMILVILIHVLMVASVNQPMGATTSSVTAQRVMEDTPVKVYIKYINTLI